MGGKRQSWERARCWAQKQTIAFIPGARWSNGPRKDRVERVCMGVGRLGKREWVCWRREDRSSLGGTSRSGCRPRNTPWALQDLSLLGSEPALLRTIGTIRSCSSWLCFCSCSLSPSTSLLGRVSFHVASDERVSACVSAGREAVVACAGFAAALHFEEVKFLPIYVDNTPLSSPSPAPGAKSAHILNPADSGTSSLFWAGGTL